MSKVTALTLNSQVYLTRMSLLLACVCAVAVLLYGIFLLEAVAHAASQTSAQRAVHAISAQLSDMEAQYLSYSQSLTKQKALDLGFVAPQQVTTVYANAALHTLSFRGQ